MRAQSGKCDKSSLWIIILFTKGNGIRKLIRKTEEVFKYGQMAPGTTDSGKMISLKDTGD